MRGAVSDARASIAAVTAHESIRGGALALTFAVLIIPTVAYGQSGAGPGGEVQTAAEVDTKADAAVVQRIIADEAQHGRSQRIRTGVAALIIGTLAVAGGARLVATAEPQGGLVDLSGVQRVTGWTFVGLGAATILVSPIPFLSTSRPEEIHTELEGAIASGDAAGGTARARLATEADARSARRTRRNFAIAGVSLLGIGALSFGALGLFAKEATNGQAVALIVGGFGGVTLGSGFLGAGLVETRAEKAAKRLRNAREADRPTVRIAPARGGGLLVIGGAF